MIRGFLRLVLLIVVLVAVGAFLLGWWGSRVRPVDEPREAVGTTGEAADRTADQARDAARTAGERTAEFADRAGERAAYAAEQTRKAIAEGSLTAKIKAKMALDDYVEAFELNVDTVGSVVTVKGTVNTQVEKDRALQLARETRGVTHVVDQVQIRQ